MIEENTPAVDDAPAEHATTPSEAEPAVAGAEEGKGEASHSEHRDSSGLASSDTPAPEVAEIARPTAKKSRKPKATAAVEAVAHDDAPAAAAEEEAPASIGVAVAEAPAAPVAEPTKKNWYVVKVQSGREDSIKAAVERKVKIEGLEEFFGQIAIPVEELIQKKSVRVTDKKTGDKVTQEKKVIKYQKKFPGYVFAEVEFNDRILYLFRETSGVGDFVGASLKRDPTPMTDREVRAMLTGVAEGDPGKQAKKVKLDYEKGDKVKIRDGAFANMEGVVKSISEMKETGETPKVEVIVTIFGRPVEVVLDYWHVDKA